MGAVNTTYTFTATDTITSTKMNNIIDQTTITPDAIIGNTLEVASGKLKVRAQGITSNEMATGSVTSNAILDNTIVNADINASAAIAGTKITPNFGTQNISTTGTVTSNVGCIISGSSNTPGLRITQTGSGHALLVEDETNPDSSPFAITTSGKVCVGDDQTYASYLPGFTTNYSAAIQGVGTTYQEGPWMSLSQYSTSTSDSGGAFISLNKSNNATKGSHTIVANNQKIGEIGWAGSNGTTFSGVAGISADVDGSPSSTSVPGRLIFSTTNVGDNVPTEKMRIDDAGNVGIGKTPTTKLDVNGTVKATAFDGNATTATTLATARTIAISGDVTGTATSFNGGANISIPATVDNGVITAPKLSGAQTGTAPIYGIRAYARVQSNGTIDINKGFSSISRSGDGVYNLTLTTAPSTGSVPAITATCHTESGNNYNLSAAVQINSSTSFTVKTGHEDVPSLNDSAFSIMVIY